MREEARAIADAIKKFEFRQTLGFFADEDKLVNEIIDEIKDEYHTELEFDDGEILLTVWKKEK